MRMGIGAGAAARALAQHVLDLLTTLPRRHDHGNTLVRSQGFARSIITTGHIHGSERWRPIASEHLS
jgi:hypothetical protein